MSQSIGFLTKADELFYEGLAALLGSLNIWYPGYEVIVLDCGLKPWQRAAVSKLSGVSVANVDTAKYRVADAYTHYYSSAIYGFFHADSMLFEHSIHVDADAVVTARIDDLMARLSDHAPGLVAVPDHPALDLSFQIGTDEATKAEIMDIIPNLKTNSITFNGGVFAIDRKYYLENMRIHIDNLYPYHDRLFGNDMAMMNLAAFAANPERPFIRAKHAYNTRQTYRRAPKLCANKIVEHRCDHHPVLQGPFGKVRILHFVGRSKPWHQSPVRDDALFVWRHYRELARKNLGL